MKIGDFEENWGAYYDRPPRCSMFNVQKTVNFSLFLALCCVQWYTLKNEGGLEK